MPYLLSGVSDENNELCLLCSNGIDEYGKQYEENHEDVTLTIFFLLIKGNSCNTINLKFYFI